MNNITILLSHLFLSAFAVFEVLCDLLGKKKKNHSKAMCINVDTRPAKQTDK